MTKKLKKYLATLLAMCMILSMASVSAFAEEGTGEENIPTGTETVELCETCGKNPCECEKNEEEPKAEEPKAEEPKAEEPKAEEPKAEEPKAEEPKAEEPKAEEPEPEEQPVVLFTAREAEATEPDWNTNSDKAMWLKNTDTYYGDTKAEVQRALFDAREYADAVIYCNPDATFENWTHMHVYNNLTVYGNGATVVSGEHDFEIDTYKYSTTESGKQDATSGQYMSGDSITLEVHELNGVAAWGQRNTDAVINLKFVDCLNMNRVYFSGTKGTNNITLTNCTFGEGASTCAVYSNAPGTITVENCTFTGVNEPINLNNKSAGEQTITVKNCTFTNCNSGESDKLWAAPIRVLCTNAGGSSHLTVDSCTFTNSGDANGDILLGEGRANSNSYPVTAEIKNTAAQVQLQSPGDRTDSENNSQTINVESSTTATEINAGIDWNASEIVISDVDTLKEFARRVNAGNTFAGKTVKLGADLDLNNEAWTPIGTEGKPFKGTFDGGNHTISNLNVTGDGYVGLFGYIGGNAEVRDLPEIRNLTVENVTVRATGNNVGGVVGNAFVAKVTNVHVTGTIDIEGYGYVGGIVGHGYVKVDNCSVEASGTIKSNFWCAGGIIGYGGEGFTAVTNTAVDGGTDGLTITSAAGAVAGIIGRAEDSNGSQPCSGSGLSVRNVNISTFTGAYGDGYADNGLAYFFGGDVSTGKLTGALEAENVTVVTSTGAAPTISDVVASVDGKYYATLQAAIDAAEPTNGVITYEIYGKAEVTSDAAWIQVVKSGITEDVSAVKFVGKTDDAEICITNSKSILADQKYDIDVSFENLKLTHPNGEYVGDLGHATKYFTCFLRNTGAAENTVTYTNCTFPNGVCNNQYGTTVFDGCTFNNNTEGKYNLWNYGGTTEVKNSEFTGTRGVKSYCEGPATDIAITISNTTFTGLSEKAAIVVSKPTNVTLKNIGVTGSTGLLTTDISGNVEVQLPVSGEGISGTFNIGSDISPETAKDEFNITGGTFSSNVEEDGYVAEGYKATDNQDGTWTVKLDETANVFAARIGNVGYATLQEAIEAAEDNQTVKLLKDVGITGDGVSVDGKKITINLDGKTITGTAGAYGPGAINLNNGAEVTLTGNGTIDASDMNYTVRVNGGSKLTVENGTYVGSTGGCLYATLGDITIYSGHFSCGEYNGKCFVLNKLDSEKAQCNFVVKGGTFVGCNPAANNNENPAENQLAEGYAAVETETGVWTVNEARVSLNQTNATLYSNTTPNTVTLAATVVPATATVTWSSSDETVATVNESGMVSVVGNGTAIITATVNNSNHVSATCTVTVSTYSAPPYVPPVTEPDEDLGDEDTPLSERPWLFVDVKEGDYFYDAVKRLFDKGIVGGTTETTYEPYTDATRGMVAQILYGMAGSPDVTGLEMPFSDVSESDFYYKAVLWGYANKVLGGYPEDNTFRGENTITREELAALLHQYGVEKLGLADTKGDLSGFIDAAEISDWAVEHMKWAVGMEIMHGDDAKKLMPVDNTIRADMTIMLNNLDMKVSDEK